MLTILILFIFYNLDSTASTSPSTPINVTFSSVNLKNVLHWFPGTGTHTDETLFTVKYAIYGESIQGINGTRVNWRPVQHCTKIVRTWCDLSNETRNIDDNYYAKVRAVDRGGRSKWEITKRFEPKIDTTFGPPLVSVETKSNSAIITMKGPMRHPPDNNTPALSMAELYPEMTYTLYVYNTRKNQTNDLSVSNSVHEYHRMEYNTEYCFYAQSRFILMPMKCQLSERLCIITPQDPAIEKLERVVVGIVVPALFICMFSAAGYLLYHYLSGRDKKSPNILYLPPFYNPPLMFLPENANLIPISSIGPEPPGNINPACPSYILQVAGSPQGYSPQRHEDYSEPAEPSDDLFVDYGGISMAPQIPVGGEDEARGGRRGDGEWRVGSSHSAGAYTPQTNSPCTCGQTPMQMQTRGHPEMNTHVQVHAWPLASLHLWRQNQALLQSAMSAVNEKKGDRETSSVSVSFQPSKKEEEKGEEVDGERELRQGQKDRGVISAYASQNDYGVIRAAPRKEREEKYYDEEEEGEALLVPKECNREGRVDEPLLSKSGKREDEDRYVNRGVLRLEDVFVRQRSEEGVAQKESGNSGETGSEVEDIFNKWGLKIPMDQ